MSFLLLICNKIKINAVKYYVNHNSKALYYKSIQNYNHLTSLLSSIRIYGEIL
jgi:hypothetical protein